MGLSLQSINFLLQAYQSGVRFEQTLTLGRQHVIASPRQIVDALKSIHNLPPSFDPGEVRQALEKTTWRFDVIARAMGAKSVVACDFSDYEGAEMIHNMNSPIAAEQEESYDVVIDGGTLEHIFNFPIAIANAMRLTKVGGSLILFTPANNNFGHGFYQFSPELFYRVLSPANGFKVRRMVATVEDIVENGNLFGIRYPFLVNGPWYEVADPEDVKSRVTLMNQYPVGLMVLAERVGREEIFKQTPQQSDYVRLWSETANGQEGSTKGGAFSSKLIEWVKMYCPETLWREFLPKIAAFGDPFRMSRYRKERSFSNERFFKKQ